MNHPPRSSSTSASSARNPKSVPAPQPKTNNQQPKTRGWVNTYYRYYKGKKLGPYYVRRWKVGRKIHREYIKPDDLERVKAECQEHREFRQKQKETSRWVTNTCGNLAYLLKMCKWEDQGRLRPQDHAFVERIPKEGYDIGGRPRTRRKVIRQLARIGDQEMIVKTVFELDGTTKTFMVPFAIKNPFDQLKEIFDQVFAEAFDGKKRPGRPRKHQNQWLQPFDRLLITDY